MTEKILITGGAGFIGCHTANNLVSNGYFVRVLDNLNRQIHPDPRKSLSKLHPNVEFIYGDVRNRSQLEDALEEIDIVYHFAAETGVGQSMYMMERYSDVTIRGTAVLCDCIARGSNVKKLILSSSRAVYGEGAYKCEKCKIVSPEARPLTQLKEGRWGLSCPHCGAEIRPIPCQEATTCQPISVYGFTKKAQEDLLSIVSTVYKIPVVIFRYFNVFGAGQSVSNPYTGILSIFTSLFLANRDIEIYEDGQMLRDFVSIHEVVNANIRAIEWDVSGAVVFNVGSGQPKTLLQLVDYLRDEIGSKSNISITGRYRVGDIRHCFANVSKLNKQIGHCSNNTFQQSIENFIAWARNEENFLTLEKSIDELTESGLSGIATKDVLNK